MRFGLTEDQKLFDHSLRGFLSARLPLDVLRRLAEPGNGFDAELWKGLGELGLQAMLVPEEYCRGVGFPRRSDALRGLPGDGSPGAPGGR